GPLIRSIVLQLVLLPFACLSNHHSLRGALPCAYGAPISLVTASMLGNGSSSALAACSFSSVRPPFASDFVSAFAAGSVDSEDAGAAGSALAGGGALAPPHAASVEDASVTKARYDKQRTGNFMAREHTPMAYTL